MLHFRQSSLANTAVDAAKQFQRNEKHFIVHLRSHTIDTMLLRTAFEMDPLFSHRRSIHKKLAKPNRFFALWNIILPLSRSISLSFSAFLSTSLILTRLNRVTYAMQKSRWIGNDLEKCLMVFNVWLINYASNIIERAVRPFTMVNAMDYTIDMSSLIMAVERHYTPTSSSPAGHDDTRAPPSKGH